MRRHSVRRLVFSSLQTTICRERRTNSIHLKRVLVVVLTALCTFSVRVDSVGAQSLELRPIPVMAGLPHTISLSDEQMKAVERWMREYTSWRAWSAEWLNKREPSLFGTRERRQRPD